MFQELTLWHVFDPDINFFANFWSVPLEMGILIDDIGGTALFLNNEMHHHLSFYMIFIFSIFLGKITVYLC